MIYELMVILLFTASLFVLWYLWFYCYTPLKLRKFRQSLFDLRHKLFLYASDGNIEFDNPIYTHSRNQINALIRFAHRLNTVDVFLISFKNIESLKQEFEEEEDKRRSAFNKLTADQRDFLNLIKDELHWRAISLIVTTSLIGLVFLAIFEVYSRLKKGFESYSKSKLLDTFRVQLNALDQAALDS